MSDSNTRLKILQTRIDGASKSITEVSALIEETLEIIEDEEVLDVLYLVADEVSDIQETLKREALVSLESSVEAMDLSSASLAVQVGLMSEISSELNTASALNEGASVASQESNLVAQGFHQGLARSRNVLLILIASFSILSLVQSYRLALGICRPLRKGVDLAQAIATGDLSVRIGSTVADEIGDLSRALDTMSDGLQDKAAMAASIAKGDLTCQVHPASESDEFGHALKEMSEQLNSVLTGVQKAAEHVGVGAREIADASTDLSDGTTRQAASLEEIFASMTELSSQVNLNATSAAKADDFSQKSRSAAVEGVDQIQELKEAMDQINTSSAEIVQVIKVIDDIAFQINLLALNAAVEAARAGQHGKGFAVVAEEVRNLAGRSATAAQESSSLIEGSLSTVRNGTEIAEKTVASLEMIVASVSQASELVSEIATACNDQARGITEVSDALGEVDRVTQQNAANSEETAAATHELTGQSGTLESLLRGFALQRTTLAEGEVVVHAPDQGEIPEFEPEEMSEVLS